ncbi:MAG: alanine--tRNA ligase [Proteobacteria bacterium]|nr:alanine--tRNA ligase [Pseudomonadota bacterium]
MKAAEVRKAFLEFFKSKGHEVVASSSIVPSNDPTLLFTNAGMVQFKDVFTGVEKRPYKRATTSQKCVRAGGKHNDLDEVGKTPRHHTFFEMLGNFSFGDYFKEDAITWAWELITKVYKFDTSRMCVTVFGGDDEHLPGVPADDEARAIWKRVTGWGDERIIGLGKADNFWMMGDTGPMGPCTEIHYFTPGVPTTFPTRDPQTWGGWLEFWNNVFMQFERRDKDGELFPLPAPSIDTGAGLERVTCILQDKQSNYDTDLFAAILAKTAALAGVTYGADPEKDTAIRVIAYHARCSTFLIGDGVFPDKTGREYVLRRIFRRAVRHGKQQLGIDKLFMHEVCMTVIDEMKDAYPDLETKRSTIEKVCRNEEELFRRTLAHGLALLEDEFAVMARTGATQVSGPTVFKLYDTFGFPEDLTQIVAGERGFTVDDVGYQAEMKKARELSKFAGSEQEVVAADLKSVAGELGATRFVGYEGTSGEGVVRAILQGAARVDRAVAGAAVQLVFDQTPFYAESGGQIGDAGMVSAPHGLVRIDDTKKPTGDMFVHVGVVERGELKVGDRVQLTVDGARRDAIRANHSATHLLNLALKSVLGGHIAQKGSLVAPDRLRFDFAHMAPMTDDEKRQVEDLVNAEIRANAASHVDVLPIEAAKQRGAVAMFGEKYGDTVRVVAIGRASLEFCGGTHVHRAGDIGMFKLLSESGVAQGVRRIEAATGVGAFDYLRRLESELGRAATTLGLKGGAQIFEVAARADKTVHDYKTLEKEIAKLKRSIASGGGGRDLLTEVQIIKGIKVLAASVDTDDGKVLRETGDALRDKLGSGVLLLAGVGGAEVKLLAMVTKDLVGTLSAGKLLAEIATMLGGRAGGKPDLAQGGGKDVAAVPAALDAARTWVANHA